MSPILQLTPRITLLPIIHGSGEFALAVRRVMLEEQFDCVAVPLPPSFQQDVERAIEFLPSPSLVTQAEERQYNTEWSPEDDADDQADDDEEERRLSYVPIDPCQGVIAGLRAAKSEHIARAFIDLETREYEPAAAVLPDPFALKKVSIDKFAAALLPAIPRPSGEQHQARIVHMARRLRELEKKHQSILCLVSVLDWPWIREAYQEDAPPILADDDVEETIC